jgi:predicted HAD superfamily Cof-like phosphohydrolase
MIEVPKSLTGLGRDKLEEMIVALGRERDKAMGHVTALQADATAKQEASLYRVVRRFHQKFNHPVEHTPKVPDADQLRFRLKLIAEEFFELLAACEIWPVAGATMDNGVPLSDIVRCSIDEDFIDPKVVNFPEFVDAMGDLDWVVEGTRAVCGVLGAPVTALIATANLAKEPAAVAAKDAHHQSTEAGAIKPMKPAGWKPPDIATELKRQGWEQ